MKRWVCPNCEGGVHAPKSPHVDDVRRFCLECSAKTGRLVRRACPSTKRVADARKDAARVKRAAAKARREAKETERWTVAGIDVRELWHKGWVALLPSVRVRLSTALLAGDREPSLSPPVLSIRRRAHTCTWCHLDHQKRMVELVFEEKSTGVHVRFNVARALAWMSTGTYLDSKTGTVANSDALSRVARRLWGFKIPTDPGPGAERALLRQLEEKFGKGSQEGVEHGRENHYSIHAPGT